MHLTHNGQRMMLHFELNEGAVFFNAVANVSLNRAIAKYPSVHLIKETLAMEMQRGTFILKRLTLEDTRLIWLTQNAKASI